jgi:xylulokinase
MHVLGIDIGTSAVKSAVIELPLLNPISTASSVYCLDYPSPDAAEVPADRLWEAIVQSVREALSHSNQHVEGVGLSALTPALCLLNAADNPIGPFWIHLDRRSRPQARKTLAEVGSEFLNSVGTRPLPGGISAISWVCRCELDSSLPKKVSRYLHPNGWAALRLTGESAFDPGNASFSGLFNSLTNQRWSPRWCDYFGVDPTWLPPVIDGAATIGRLRTSIAEELGLPANIPVKLGTADTSCGMLAAQLKPGELYHNIGTTQVLATITNSPQPDSRRLTRLFGVGKSFVHVAHNPIGGVALEWLYKLCFADVSRDGFFDKIIPQTIHRPTEIRLDPPFLGGDRLQIEEAFAAFQNLTLSTDRLDLLAAVLQTMRNQHKKAIEALGAVLPFRRIVVSGGGTRWIRQLIPGYDSAETVELIDGAVRGAAALFLPSAPTFDSPE